MDDLIGLCLALLFAAALVAVFAAALGVAVVFFVVWGLLELSARIYERKAENSNPKV